MTTVGYTAYFCIFFLFTVEYQLMFATLEDSISLRKLVEVVDFKISMPASVVLTSVRSSNGDTELSKRVDELRNYCPGVL